MPAYDRVMVEGSMELGNHWGPVLPSPLSTGKVTPGMECHALWRISVSENDE